MRMRAEKQDARTKLKPRSNIAPKNVNAHYRLARLYRSMGMTAQAKVEFDKASSLNKTEDDRLLKIMSTIPAGKDSSAGTEAVAGEVRRFERSPTSLHHRNSCSQKQIALSKK